MKRFFAFAMAMLMLLLSACPAAPTDGTSGTTVKQPIGSTTGTGTGGQPEAPIERTFAKTYPYTDEDGVLHIRYQDSYTFDARIDEITDVNITSRVCGTDTPDAELLTVERDGKTVTAVGCGSATVTSRFGEQRIAVDPSPINLLLVSGQSNAAGGHASSPPYDPADYPKYFLRSPETMAYFTYTWQELDVTYPEGSGRHPNAYVINSLKWGDETRYSATATSGPKSTTLCDENSDFSMVGFCGALAAEWVEKTGERVWIVNASHGGHPINNFLPSSSRGTPAAPEAQYNDYEQAKAVFSLALETVRREAEAGHFTLNHYGFYWMQGESDSVCRDTYYLAQFERMYTALENETVYRAGDAEKKIEFAGLVSVRSCEDSKGNSTAELYLTGPRMAQLELAAAGGALENVWFASEAGDRFTGKDEDMVAYLLARYGSEENFLKKFGYGMPTSCKQMHPDIHYAIFGYNEIGTDMAENTLMLLYEKYPENCYPVSYPDTEKETSVKLIGRDGYSALETVSIDLTAGYGYVVPRLTPYYRNSLGVTLVSETEGFRFEHFRLYPVGVAKNEITFRVEQQGRVLARYTLPVSYTSSLKGASESYRLYGGDYNLPAEIVTVEGDNPWSLGWLNYKNGTFTAFSVTDADGWLHEEGETKWTGTWHGGFRDYMMGLSSASGEGLGIAYTVRQAGRLSVAIEALTNGVADVRLAVFCNGQLVWPSTATAEDPDSTDGWYLLKGGEDATSAATVNEALSALVLDVEVGDEVVFVFERVGDTPQKTVYPMIFYINDEE